MKLWITTKMTRIYRLECARCNCYLILRDGHYILVDTGAAYDRKKIEKQLDRLGVHKLDAIFITHVHTDHVENAKYIAEKYHADVFVHEIEKEMLENGKCIMPGGMNIWTRFISLLMHKTKLYSNFEKVKSTKTYPMKQYNQLSAAKVKRIGKEQDFDLIVLETKGHTDGSVSIIVDHEVALVGDAMSHSLVGNIYPSFGESEEEILDSWKMLLSTKCKLFLPAHGRSIKRRLLVETLSVYKAKKE